jgi:nicotinamide-nucleotide amidase
MNAEIITIGTELLLGDIVDTNAAWMAQQLAAAGVDVYFRTTVGDNVTRIANAIGIALSRAEVVITTGGLGPTVDDMTREAVAQATRRELVLDEELLAQVRARFAKWNVPMSENNVRQAYIPRGATAIENPVGTAPVFIVAHEGRYVISLPGVPREMKHLMETRILPFLREKTGGSQIILSKTLRTCAIGESLIDAQIADLETSANPTVGLLAHPGQVDVRITAKAKTRAEAEGLIREMEQRVRERLGDAIYGEGEETVPEVVARLLIARGWSLAIGETNTRGAIAQSLWDTPEGARILKTATALEVSEVSEDRAALIAETLRKDSGAAMALAIIGTTGAEEDFYGAETGRTVMALATERGTTRRDYPIGGMSEMAVAWVKMRALDWVRRVVNPHPNPPPRAGEGVTS